MKSHFLVNGTIRGVARSAAMYDRHYFCCDPVFCVLPPDGLGILWSAVQGDLRVLVIVSRRHAWVYCHGRLGVSFFAT